MSSPKAVSLVSQRAKISIMHVICSGPHKAIWDAKGPLYRKQSSVR